jgi:hypothetical protein
MLIFEQLSQIKFEQKLKVGITILLKYFADREGAERRESSSSGQLHDLTLTLVLMLEIH